MSISWMAYSCRGCLPAQGCCRLQRLGAWALYHWSPNCRKVHKLLPNLLVHLLQLSHSNHLVEPEGPALVFDRLETGVPCRIHQLHFIITRCWCIYLNDGNVERALISAAPSWVCLKMGGILWHFSQYPYALGNPLLVHACSLFHWNTLWSPSVGISPDVFHFISHNLRMRHLYRSISCKSSSTLPAALRVLTFHVSMVISSLPPSLAPVAFGTSSIVFVMQQIAIY